MIYIHIDIAIDMYIELYIHIDSDGDIYIYTDTYICIALHCMTSNGRQLISNQ